MKAPKVLVADDEKGMRDFLSILLRKQKYDVSLAASGKDALELISTETFDLLISDIRMPDLNGIDLLRKVREISPDTLVLLITAYASTKTAVAALKLGAYDYITKPFDVEEFKIVVQNALEKRRLQQENATLRRELHTRRGFERVIGRSDAIKRVMDLAARVADTTATILLTGERGTGKEVIAHAIHDASPRCNRPFVSVNCAAIQESLLESELFGHVRGAFTGASTSQEGLFESASGGTILLDEVGEMSSNMQAKLLRVLQEKTVRRVGGRKETAVDVRVIASTNRDLEKEVESGAFRADLFDRLNVIAVEVPPLRQRQEDIPLLLEHFVREVASEMGRDVKGIEPDALFALERYDWPGNVRELENVIRRSVALSTGGELVTVASLPDAVLSPKLSAESTPLAVDFNLEEHLDAERRRYLQEALAAADGKRVEAARRLGITFRALRYYVKKYDLG